MTGILPRHAITLGREMLDAFPCLAIQGARQAGKSTLAQLLTEDRPALHLNLDDPEVIGALEADPRSFVEQTPHTLVIDEAQRHPDLFLAIKSSIDRDRRPGRFVLTGSANLLHLKGVEDSLAGRVVDLLVRPLTQGELHDQHDDFISAVVNGTLSPATATSTWTRSDYAHAMERGGYPELTRLNGRMRSQWIRSYLARVLERDARSIPNGSNAARLESTLRLIAANQSGELVKARFAASAGYAETLVQGYLDALSSVYLIDQLRPWTPNLTTREIGRRKVCVTDSALAMHLIGTTADSLLPLTSDHIGPLFEGFIVGQLLSQQVWSDVDFNVHHYRDRSGIEVDIVIELFDGRVIGIEVKSSSTYRPEYFKGLAFLKERLKDRFIGGFVLGMGDHGHQFAERLWGLPASTLWEHDA